MYRNPFYALVSAFTAVTLLLAASVASAAAPTTQLPRTVRPTHYDIAIVPDAEQRAFASKVTIDIEVLEPTATITLNALDLVFGPVQLSDAHNVLIAQPKVQVDKANQTATFVFDKSLPKGSYRLAMKYRGKINTQANGLFAIDYDTAAGHKRALYTQFENSDARRFIPSWDEPAYKATFSLEATVPSKQTAISNMPIEHKAEINADRSAIRFTRTPKMSTYLLFFGLGEFDRITARVGPTEVGVIAQRGSAAQGQFALDSASAILREYNDYFAIPYPLPKLDNIASPGSSRFFSAMENWGAIYTFEYAILLNPSISTQADKQNVFSDAAHEMAHQWFGDLVTMSWWDDLWLNEGFATWMASRTTAKLHPEWDTMLDDVGGREAAIGRDSLATTHPVVQHVTTVEQASQAFDSITYQKGSAVIRMIEEYVGHDPWRAGVRQYIRKHAYGNTVSDDLWREIEAAAKKPILAIAHDFTLQPGVPMLRVAAPKCANNSTTLELTQAEFSKDQPNKKPLVWRVPVIAKPLAADTEVRTLVTNGKATLTVPGCGVVILNAGQSGYYRTLYSAEQFAQIKDRFTSLATIDQLGIFSDTWALGLAGYRSSSDVLDLAAVVSTRAHPKVWGLIAGTFGNINNIYGKDSVNRQSFRRFAIAKLAPILTQIGWIAQRGESDSIAILREQLINVLSALDDNAVIAEAQRRFAAAKTDTTAIPPALRKTILRVVARHADAATWDRLHNDAKNEKTALIKDDLYELLATTEDESLARRALDLALTPEPGATNSAELIGRVANLHPDLAFDFAIAHLAAVDEKVDISARSSFYPGLASGSFDPTMIAKIKAYMDTHVAAKSRRDAETAIARIKYGIKVRNERLPAIDAWLARNSIKR